jgi:hypothetical protein
LSNCGNREIARVAYQLSDLHSARNRADYRLDRKDIEQPAMAQAIAAQAGAMIAVLDQIFSGPLASSLQTAIRDWRKQNGYP